MKRVYAVLIGTCMLTACSTEMRVVELPSKDTGTVVDGVPLHVRERFLVEIYKKTNDGYKLVGQQLETLPNSEKVYILRHDGQAFANGETKFVLRSDSTLASVNVTSESKAADALSSAGEQLNAIGKQIGDIKQARQDRKATREVAIDKEDSLGLAYEKAKAAAEVAAEELNELPADTKGSVRRAKETEIRVLQLEANTAARKVGQPKPFP